jgi:hypothetical protein
MSVDVDYTGGSRALLRWKFGSHEHSVVNIYLGDVDRPDVRECICQRLRGSSHELSNLTRDCLYEVTVEFLDDSVSTNANANDTGGLSQCESTISVHFATDPVVWSAPRIVMNAAIHVQLEFPYLPSAAMYEVYAADDVMPRDKWSLVAKQNAPVPQGKATLKTLRNSMISLKLETLHPSKTYYLLVKGISTTGHVVMETRECVFRTSITLPQKFTIFFDNVSDKVIHMQWPEVEKANLYEIEEMKVQKYTGNLSSPSSASDTPRWISIASTEQCQLTREEREPQTNYQYRLRVWCGELASPFCLPAEIRTASVAPAAPVLQSITTVSTTVSWSVDPNELSTAIMEFEARRISSPLKAAASQIFRVFGQQTAKKGSGSLLGLLPGESYDVRIRVGHGNGAVWSDYSPLLQIYTRLDAVGTLRPVQIRTSSVTVAWQAVHRANKYLIFAARALYPQDFKLMGELELPDPQEEHAQPTEAPQRGEPELDSDSALDRGKDIVPGYVELSFHVSSLREDCSYWIKVQAFGTNYPASQPSEALLLSLAPPAPTSFTLRHLYSVGVALLSLPADNATSTTSTSTASASASLSSLQDIWLQILSPSVEVAPSTMDVHVPLSALTLRAPLSLLQGMLWVSPLRPGQQYVLRRRLVINTITSSDWSVPCVIPVIWSAPECLEVLSAAPHSLRVAWRPARETTAQNDDDKDEEKCKEELQDEKEKEREKSEQEVREEGAVRLKRHPTWQFEVKCTERIVLPDLEEQKTSSVAAVLAQAALPQLTVAPHKLAWLPGKGGGGKEGHSPIVLPSFPASLSSPPSSAGPTSRSPLTVQACEVQLTGLQPSTKYFITVRQFSPTDALTYPALSLSHWCQWQSFLTAVAVLPRAPRLMEVDANSLTFGWDRPSGVASFAIYLIRQPGYASPNASPPPWNSMPSSPLPTAPNSPSTSLSASPSHESHQALKFLANTTFARYTLENCQGGLSYSLAVCCLDELGRKGRLSPTCTIRHVLASHAVEPIATASSDRIDCSWPLDRQVIKSRLRYWQCSPSSRSSSSSTAAAAAASRSGPDLQRAHTPWVCKTCCSIGELQPASRYIVVLEQKKEQLTIRSSRVEVWTKPAAPSRPVISSVSSSSVGLVWDELPHASAYEVQQANGDSDCFVTLHASVVATVFVAEQLRSQEVYHFRIRGVQMKYEEGDTESDWSPTCSVTTAI